MEEIKQDIELLPESERTGTQSLAYGLAMALPNLAASVASDDSSLLQLENKRARLRQELWDQGCIALWPYLAVGAGAVGLLGWWLLKRRK
jgi:hypothetical protein